MFCQCTINNKIILYYEHDNVLKQWLAICLRNVVHLCTKEKFKLSFYFSRNQLLYNSSQFNISRDLNNVYNKYMLLLYNIYIYTLYINPIDHMTHGLSSLADGIVYVTYQVSSMTDDPYHIT